LGAESTNWKGEGETSIQVWALDKETLEVNGKTSIGTGATDRLSDICTYSDLVIVAGSSTGAWDGGWSGMGSDAVLGLFDPITDYAYWKVSFHSDEVQHDNEVVAVATIEGPNDYGLVYAAATVGGSQVLSTSGKGGTSDALLGCWKADNGELEWIRVLGSGGDDRATSLTIESERIYISWVTDGEKAWVSMFSQCELGVGCNVFVYIARVLF
jgi:hypothetical protein